jgi:pimeloyl-ACP methyl ester carboxylesterase
MGSVTGQTKGKTVQSEDALIYYETTGSGPVVVFLHGDVFGYIDEFNQYIPLLVPNYKVISIAMRGHGKSELGKQRLSYEILANDVFRVLAEEKCDKVSLVGFSAGASIAYYFASKFPEKVSKVVGMAGATGKNDFRNPALKELMAMNADSLMARYPSFIKYRISMMAEPERFQELIDNLKGLWFLKQYLPGKGLGEIKAPVLVVGGDSDYYFDVSTYLSIHRKIRNAKLAVIPDCDHVGLITKPGMFKEIILPFLQKKENK